MFMGGKPDVNATGNELLRLNHRGKTRRRNSVPQHGCAVRPRPLKMDHIAFHRSSAVRIETVNDLISVFGSVVESR